jgi:hypothetical protein
MWASVHLFAACAGAGLSPPATALGAAGQAAADHLWYNVAGWNFARSTVKRDRLQDIFEIGQRNVEDIALVKAWCAHVRIERFSGGGIVEEMTGLPTGLHGLACDHASAGGIYAHRTREVALDFYDRHCHDCALRTPVSTPNLSVWVEARDAWRAQQDAAEAQAVAEAAAALAARQAARAALRAGLAPASADILDQIDELDRAPTTELSVRLVETARLAKEAFTPPVVEHIFELLESGQGWFEVAGLETLAAVSSDPDRLVRCALKSLADGVAVESAVRALLPRLAQVDPVQIGAILPALIELARPTREVFSMEQRPRPAPLVLVHAAFPEAVRAALDKLLAGEPLEVHLATRALVALVRRAPGLLAGFARTLISTYVRAPWLPDPGDFGQDIEHEASHRLREAVVAAFLRQPDIVDGLLKAFSWGASPAAEVRIFGIYGWVLRAGRFRRTRPVSAAGRLAFERLLWGATSHQNAKVLSEIHSAIHENPDDLIGLAKTNIDQLLGAAILVDARLRAHDDTPPPKDATMLTALERMGDRSVLYGLRDHIVAWAAAGAAAAGTPRAYLDVLDNLGEEGDELAGCLIERAMSLIDSAEGLNAVLPSLYRALVGTSVLRRGAAAKAVGEIPARQRKNAPDLLFEAFLSTLTDPYIYVHSAAARTLRQITLPEAYSARVQAGLVLVLRTHAGNPEREELVLGIIEELSHILSEANRAGPYAAWLVRLMAGMRYWTRASKLRWIARGLARAEGLVDLLIAHLLDPECTEHSEEEMLEVIADLPADVVYANRAALAAVPIGAAWPHRFRVYKLVETLGRCGAWAEAEQAAAAAVAATPDTARDASVRLGFQLLHAATAYENALALGDSARATAMAAEWRTLKAAEEAHKRAIAERPDPFRDVREASGRR